MSGSHRVAVLQNPKGSLILEPKPKDAQLQSSASIFKQADDVVNHARDPDSCQLSLVTFQ